ncbi:selenocysteine-specific translation elongation factor [Chromobacterium haemolyticum]|nr:selenocysteine-specific translation elongation factor [Chromobacterium haemolyticum]
MTIDLGYAYLPTPDGGAIGFIDVPGHERFLGNMLAGVGGVRHALLVIAADDGVMPQTREHLAILQLLQLDSLTVAVSKSDLVGPEALERVMSEARQTLTEHGLQATALLPVSARTGVGVDDLRRQLLQQRGDATGTERRFRLAIDRAFTIGGAGLVVTGTAWGGRVSMGDTLWLSGKDVPVRVRGLHVQNQPARQGQAGQRIALNLAGDIEKNNRFSAATGCWRKRPRHRAPASASACAWLRGFTPRCAIGRPYISITRPATAPAGWRYWNARSSTPATRDWRN